MEGQAISRHLRQVVRSDEKLVNRKGSGMATSDQVRKDIEAFARQAGRGIFRNRQRERDELA